MSTEQKVAQLLLVHFVGEEANNDARILINDMQVGGIIYYNWANGLHSPAQIATLSHQLQTLAKQNKSAIPLFIAVDQEGGVVTRLTHGFTIFPGNRALAMTNKLALIKSCAYTSGKELLAVGINLNFSPSVDVNDNPQNPIIGLRSFGSDPHLVAKCARELVLGYKAAGIITALKHFPGHGNATVDSHDSLPIITKTRQELELTELLPFKLLIPIADMIMTGHLLVPALDPHNCATFSKPILRDLLKDEMGYEGIVISDSMIMQGLIAQSFSLEDAAIKAIEAGCDILILGGKLLTGKHQQDEIGVGDVRKIHMALVEAVKQGKISSERLDLSVRKILKLKAAYNLSHEIKSDFTILKSPSHLMLATQVAEEAIRVVKSDCERDLVLNSNVTIICPQLLEDALSQSIYLRNSDASIIFISLEPTEEELQQCLSHACQTKRVLFFSYNAWRHQKQAALIHTLMQQGSHLQLICLRDPQDGELFSDAQGIIITFNPTLPSIDAALKRLINENTK